MTTTKTPPKAPVKKPAKVVAPPAPAPEAPAAPIMAPTMRALTGESVELGQSAEFFFVALTTLQQTGKTNLIPELLQILTPRQLMQVVQVYGGKTIKLPSPRELSYALKLGLYIYKTDFLHQGEKAIVAELDLTPEELTRLKTGREEWYAETKAAMGMGMYQAVLQQRDGANHG